MKEITTHHVHGALNTVRVFPEGDPGVGGAHTNYRLTLGLPGQETGTSVVIKFQNGPPKDGVNGITNESLLSVVIDRLKDWQANSKVSCRENAVALTHLETALLWLHHRTRDRVARGVEGEVRP